MTKNLETFMRDLARKYFAAGKPDIKRWGMPKRSMKAGVADEAKALGLLESDSLKVALCLTDAGLLWVLATESA